MASKLFKTVILGAPASGKGTISSRIVKNFNLEHISSGDLLRLNIQHKTEIGTEADKFIREGKLVPDDLMIKFILNEIHKVADKPLLLDGFPRTLSQAKSLWDRVQLDVVLNLRVPFDVIIERVKGRWVHLPSGRVYNNDFNAPKVAGKDDVTGEDLVQRDDDKPEIVLERLKQYEKLTRPVVNFYNEKGVLVNFEGRTSDEIWPKVLDSLSSYIPLQITTKKYAM